MKNLIAGLIVKDQPLDISFVPADGKLSSFRGSFVTSDDNAMAVNSPDGYTRIIPFASIYYLDVFPAETSAAPSDDAEPLSAQETPVRAEEPDPDVFSNTPQLAPPKVVGRIDLAEYGRSNRFRRNSPFQHPQASSYQTDTEEELLPAMGKISRLGPNFGFIQPNDPNAGSVYVARNEIISLHGVMRAPVVGDEVIYTNSVNRQGNAAKCVHCRCSLHTLEEMASRMHSYDHRAAALLRARVKAVHEGTPLDQLGDAPFAGKRPERPAEAHVSLDADTVLQKIRNGEEVTARNITESEEQLSANTPYPEFIAALGELLDYSMDNNLSAVHRLLSRGIRVARENEDIDTALSFARKACNYYRDMPGNFKFFSTIENRLLNPVVIPAAEPDGDNDEAEQPIGDEAEAPAEATETTVAAPAAETHSDDAAAAEEAESDSVLITI